MSQCPFDKKAGPPKCSAWVHGLCIEDHPGTIPCAEAAEKSLTAALGVVEGFVRDVAEHCGETLSDEQVADHVAAALIFAEKREDSSPHIAHVIDCAAEKDATDLATAAEGAEEELYMVSDETWPGSDKWERRPSAQKARAVCLEALAAHDKRKGKPGA